MQSFSESLNSAPLEAQVIMRSHYHMGFFLTGASGIKYAVTLKRQYDDYDNSYELRVDFTADGRHHRMQGASGGELLQVYSSIIRYLEHYIAEYPVSSIVFHAVPGTKLTSVYTRLIKSLASKYPNATFHSNGGYFVVELEKD